MARAPRSTTQWLQIGLVVSVALAGVFASTVVAAQDNPESPPAEVPSARWAVQPSGPQGPGERDWFTYTLSPGDTFGDTVAVSNLSDRPLRFVIYPADAYGVADVGGMAAQREDEEAVDVGSWIRLAANEYTLEPGKRADIPFSISVPDDAQPGDHAGAILAIDADDAALTPSERGVALDVRNRVGARVYVRVNGPITPSVRIDQIVVERHGSKAVVRWEITNDGNARLNPTAELRVTGFLGREITTIPAQQLPELLPDGNYVGATEVRGLPGFERLTAQLIIKAEGVEVKGSTRFGSYPWLIIGLVIAVGLGILYLRRRRSRRGSGRQGDQPPTRSPERETVLA